MARAMLERTTDMSRSITRRSVAGAVLTFLGCLSSSTRAQSLDINPAQSASLPRTNASGAAVNKRPTSLTPEGVSYQDCIDDLVIQFPLVFSGFTAGGSLEAYAARGGVQCEVLTNQTGATQQCWQLATIPLTINPIVPIRVRKIMAGLGEGTPLDPKDDPSNCGKVDLSTLSVQFLYYNPGDRTTPVKKEVTLSFDTIGPDPPTGLQVLPGNQRIVVKWANISGGDPDAGTSGGSTQLNGIRIYCDAESTVAPAAGTCTDVANDAGEDGGDAGTTKVCTDAGTTPAQCGSANLTSADGKALLPSASLDKFVCGGISGSTGTTAVAENRVNGTQYAIAVAASDYFGNYGPLSSVKCETPEVTTDFWDEYRKAGGAAGGGCTSSGTNAPLGTAAASIIAVSVAISSFTRRRKRR